MKKQRDQNAGQIGSNQDIEQNRSEGGVFLTDHDPEASLAIEHVGNDGQDGHQHEGNGKQ